MFDEVNYIYIFFCPSTFFPHNSGGFFTLLLAQILFSLNLSNIFKQLSYYFPSHMNAKFRKNQLSIVVDVNLDILNILTSFDFKFKFNSSVKNAMNRGCCQYKKFYQLNQHLTSIRQFLLILNFFYKYRFNYENSKSYQKYQ